MTPLLKNICSMKSSICSYCALLIMYILMSSCGGVVEKNTAGSSDNRNALAIGNLQVANILSDGTASYQSSYSQMVSMVGNQGNQAKIGVEAQNTLVKEARTAKSSFSGVNLDEEAANLIKYQQAYQAASKVIAIAQQTFQSILEIG